MFYSAILFPIPGICKCDVQHVCNDSRGGEADVALMWPVPAHAVGEVSGWEEQKGNGTFLGWMGVKPAIAAPSIS